MRIRDSFRVSSFWSGWYYSLPARKSSFFIHGQGVDVVQEVANLFGTQRRRALGEVRFYAFQKQRFFSGNGTL
jgi:hypothetical protein